MLECWQLDDLDAAALLGLVGDQARQVEDSERWVFVAAAAFADLNHPEGRFEDGSRVIEGGEAATCLGGPGTPLVLEFAVADLAVAQGISTGAARAQLADSLDVRHRLPRMWAGVRAGRVRVRLARLTAVRTRHLSVEAAGLVDAAMVELADGRLSYGRFESRLLGKVAEADPEAAARAEAAAAADVYARAGRENDHGHTTLYIKTQTGAVEQIGATIGWLAEALKALGDTGSVDQRRARATLVMANPLAAVALLQAWKGAAPATTEQPAAPTRVEDETGHPLPADPTEPDDAADAADNRAGSGTGPADPDDGAGPESGPAAGGAGSGHAAGGAGAGGDVVGVGGGNAFAVPAFRLADYPPGDPRAWLALRRRLLPEVTLFLHISAGTVIRAATAPQTGPGSGINPADPLAPTGATGVVRWEGGCPVTDAYLRRFLGPDARFTVRPVLDVPGQAPVDAYEIPDAHRTAVRLMTPADVFPWGTCQSRHMDLDHTVPHPRGPADRRRAPRPADHRDGGPTEHAPDADHDPVDGPDPARGASGIGNYGPLTRFHHRIKTHGGWQLTQPFPGIYLWRSPQGEHFLVDHTGTRNITRQTRAAQTQTTQTRAAETWGGYAEAAAARGNGGF